MQPIKGFSKLSKAAKIEWISNQYFKEPEAAYELLSHYWHTDEQVQKLHDEFIENTLTNFYMPYGVAPNFLLNGKLYTIPMVIEESSVVAAASKSAAFWLTRGGFKAEVISTKKIGQVHFIWNGDAEKLAAFMPELREQLLEGTADITANMRARGGGISSIELVNKSDLEPGYFQLHATFETKDAMGANFINSNLEEFARILRRTLATDDRFTEAEKDVTIVMCILSNYTPECLVRCEVSCPVDQLADGDDYTNEEFIEKFTRAIRIATIEPYRATTHNKGIMNGIDSVVLATGNDFRAVEACAHTYAARDGQYRSLTKVSVENGIFRFWIDIPLAMGTVGSLTTLHPMVKFSHELLGHPNAEELMMITAAVGLAQNFAAVKSLVTTGIQKGHMKMHLLNILNQLEATDMEKERTKTYFSDKVVSFQAVAEFLKKLRGEPAVQILPGKSRRKLQANRFYAHGKLLLTAEYLVLHGATALALPTRQGQWLEARPTENGELWWQAFDEHDQRWLEVRFRLPDLHILQSTDAEAALRLQQQLLAAERHKPGCVRHAAGWLVQTRLEFNRHWGLGSSSLVSLMAQWLQLDPFTFYFETQTGSGYDLACATATGPILYTRHIPQPQVQAVRFQPPFAQQLRWVYLGQKQNSLREVKSYLRSGKPDAGLLHEVSDITRSILNSTELEGFSTLLAEHEAIIGHALGRKTLGETQFAGYPGQAKSLGAWGGDFVLLTLPEPEACLHWLANNHFETVLSYDTLV